MVRRIKKQLNTFELFLVIIGIGDAEGPPVPIPNTEVKPCSAEDSAMATWCENRKMPISDSEYFFIQNRSAVLVYARWAPYIKTNRYNTFYS